MTCNAKKVTLDFTRIDSIDVDTVLMNLNFTSFNKVEVIIDFERHQGMKKQDISYQTYFTSRGPLPKCKDLIIKNDKCLLYERGSFAFDYSSSNFSLNISLRSKPA